MLTVATTVTENSMLVSKFLPQNNAAFFCVVSLNKSKKVHNQKQLKHIRNLGYSAVNSKPCGMLQHNLTKYYTHINV